MFGGGGISEERKGIADIAESFRNLISDLPFIMVSESMSNAVTALHPITKSAKEIVQILRDEYQIWVCPNGGDKADEVFRVGHIGHITPEDNQVLINALHDMSRRGML